MVSQIPATRDEQKPVIREILFLILLLQRLELLEEFADSPRFKEELEDPLEALAKFRDPQGRVARLAAYLKKLRKANRRERHKLLRENAPFVQLIGRLKEASDWSDQDNELFSQILHEARTRSGSRNQKTKLTLAAAGIGSILISVGLWYACHRKPAGPAPEEKAES